MKKTIIIGLLGGFALTANAETLYVTDSYDNATGTYTKISAFHIALKVV